MTVYFSCRIQLVSMFTKDFSWKLYTLSYKPSSCLLLIMFSSCKSALQVGHLSGLAINVDELVIDNLPRDSLLKLCLGLCMTLSSFSPSMTFPQIQVPGH